ncbi:hypothetical protein N7488_010773 [Penicillium malachiteum]|nr:hypothetical protein N7488_010773 [Penicillium malachiteum]
MRFLCCHGTGTNSKILETQLAALKHELGDGHTYDFAEGIVPSSLAPELVGIFPAEGNYFDYFSHNSAESATKALDDLGRFLELEGPYDGFIGFSIGAAVLASYLIREVALRPSKPLPVKCAIFLSGGAPLDHVALERGEVALVDSISDTPLLPRLPTAHIWGRNDKLWAGRSELLLALCDSEASTIYLHDEAHAVPGPRAKDALLGSARAIRRMIDQATLGG